MSKKTIILSSRQLNEIIGYLDSPQNDFKANANNEIFASDKFDGEDGKPVKDLKFMRRNSFGLYGSRGVSTFTPVCEDDEHMLYEINTDTMNLNTVFSDNDSNYGTISSKASSNSSIMNARNGISNHATESALSRMKKNKELAQKGDINASIAYQKQGGAEAEKKFKDTLTQQRNNAHTNDERKKKLGMSVIKSAPKTHTGTAHMAKNKNGYITPINNNQ